MWAEEVDALLDPVDTIEAERTRMEIEGYYLGDVWSCCILSGSGIFDHKEWPLGNNRMR